MEAQLETQSITDEEERAKASLEIAKEKSLRDIENMKITEEQKQRLRTLTEDDTQRQLDEITATYQEKT